MRALLYEHLHVLSELVTEHGEWLLEMELTEADLAWLHSLPDFDADRMLLPESAPQRLARTGS